MGKTIRAARSGLLIIALLLLLPSLFLYTSLAVYGKRLLTFNEWSRFAGIIAFAGIAHLDTNGGPRAWAIVGESLSPAALSKVALSVDAHTYEIPLPPNTIRKNCDRIVAGLPKGSTGRSSWPTIPQSCLSGSEFPTEFPSFITLASPDEMNRYVHVTLPAAGWVFQDRLGSAWIFRNNDTQLMMILGSYLTIFITDFSLNLDVRMQKSGATQSIRMWPIFEGKKAIDGAQNWVS